MHHDPEYCRGIAMVLKGESLKAGRCVTHNASLGGLRERMVARFVRDATPGRLRVESGLIHSARQALTSRQCDLLVHAASTYATLYRGEDFVIIEPDAAEAVIEVKTTLDQAAFDEVREIQSSISVLKSSRGCTPVFCYALEGVTFETFLGYISSALRETGAILAVPNFMVVQARHYFAVRPVNQPPDGFRVYAVNLAADLDVDGLETGVFLEFYRQTMHSRHDAFQGRSLSEWFGRIGKAYHCASISLNGDIQRAGPERGPTG
jgi:hypothetical protein